MPADVRYRVNAPSVIGEVIDGEAVIINLATGDYFSLGGCGAEVWQLLEQGATASQMAAVLASRYDIGRDELETAVGGLLADLADDALVQPDGGAGAVGPAPALEESDGHDRPAVRQPFEPPRLEKYTDMQDLILLDPVHEVDERGWPHARPGRGEPNGA